MIDGALAEAVHEFAAATHAFDEDVLARPWAWKEYDEGVRVAFFRTYEELRELAALTLAERDAARTPPTTAQRLLGQYHAAYRDLEAVLLGVQDGDLDRAPAAGEWPVRNVLGHIIRADVGFFAGIVRDALEQLRRGVTAPAPMSDEARQAARDAEMPALQAALAGPLAGIVAYYEGLHGRILGTVVDTTDAELAAPTWYWESEPMPLRFRLLRFDSHLRQHTIQAEKTLVAIGRPPTEARRLLRQVYNALAEAESAAFGAPEAGDRLRRAVVDEITARAREMRALA